MPPSETNNAEPTWPRPLRLVVSVVLIVHLLAITGLVLSSGSGPWLTPDGTAGYAHSPVFASKLYFSLGQYLDALRLQDDYRFRSNLYQEAANKIEIDLKDADGKTIKTVELPSGGLASFREQLLVDVLSGYKQVEPRAGEVVPAPGQAPPTARYWRTDPENGMAELVTVDEHLVPRDEPVFAPSEYATRVARAIARRATRENNAASADLIRISKPYTGTSLLMSVNPEELAPENFDAAKLSLGTFTNPNASR